MSDITTSNAAFTKVQDTIYDSKLLAGLAQLSILPKSFRVIKAVMNVDDTTTAVDGVATAGTIAAGESGLFIDSETGEAVYLEEGEQIVFLSAVSTTALVSGGSATVEIGTTAATTTDALATTIAGSTTAFATFNTSGLNLAAAGTLVQASEPYLKFEVATASITAGVVQCVLIVV